MHDSLGRILSLTNTTRRVVFSCVIAPEILFVALTPVPICYVKSPRFQILLSVAMVCAWNPATVVAQTLSDGTVLRVQATRQLKVGKDTLIYNRVARPVVPPSPPATVMEVVSAPDEAEAKLGQVFLSLTAYVYDGVTELVWIEPESEGERVHRALSNVDFNHFPMQFDYRTGDTHYAVTVMTFNFGAGLPADLTRTGAHAAVLAALRGKPGYDFVEVTDGGAAMSATDFELLDVLHAYYAVNRVQMAAVAEQQAQRATAEAQKLQEEALKLKTITVSYWREEAPTAAP